MTDRELLELAAKAAGIKGFWVENHPEDGAPAYSFGIGRGSQVLPLWNPLREDGDAFRLSVRLGINVLIRVEGHTIAELDFLDRSIGSRCAAAEEHGDDACSATRRAIVRAAAEIGQKME